MPPKKTSRKLTKGEESASDEHISSEEDQPKKPQKVVVAKPKKEELKKEEPTTQVKSKSKAKEEEQKWDEQSQEGSNHDQNEQCNEENQSDQDDHVEQKDTHHEKPHRGARYQSSALKFKYEDFLNLETPVHELTNRELVKILIARSHNDGQYQCCSTMRDVLRAMNLECDFPRLVSHRPPLQRSQGGQARPNPSFAPRSGFRGDRQQNDTERGTGMYNQQANSAQGRFAGGWRGRGQGRFQRNDQIDQ